MVWLVQGCGMPGFVVQCPKSDDRDSSGSKNRLELSKCEMEVLDREGSEPKDDLLAKLRVHGKFYCILCLWR